MPSATRKLMLVVVCMAVGLVGAVRVGEGASAREKTGAATEWDSLKQESISRLRKGDYVRATVVAKKALQVAEQALGPDHPNVGLSLNNLAVLYRALGQYAQAEPLFKRALTIRENALGPGHPAVATILENLAGLYRKTNRANEAEPLEKRAAAIRAIKR